MNAALRHALLAFALTSAAAALTGCRKPRSVAELVAELQAPDATKRRDAADDLQTDEGVPVQAIPHLLEAARRETDPRTLGTILMTLGKSGVPEAQPLIGEQLATQDKSMRRWVGRALQYWLIANGRLPPNPTLPSGWPYGQPGFPPLLPEED